ncbi:cation exchanger 9 [Tanacetum coccineum]|uniref:Cation exchanger 9 n=1 Tax=Tanacetum coccineum TaxID=301880 RepID=A0ABQ5BVM0_9ASTR
MSTSSLQAEKTVYTSLTNYETQQKPDELYLDEQPIIKDVKEEDELYLDEQKPDELYLDEQPIIKDVKEEDEHADEYVDSDDDEDDKDGDITTDDRLIIETTYFFEEFYTAGWAHSVAVNGSATCDTSPVGRQRATSGFAPVISSNPVDVIKVRVMKGRLIVRLKQLRRKCRWRSTIRPDTLIGLAFKAQAIFSCLENLAESNYGLLRNMKLTQQLCFRAKAQHILPHRSQQHRDSRTISWQMDMRIMWRGYIKDEISRGEKLISTKQAMARLINFCKESKPSNKMTEPTIHLIAAMRQIMLRSLDSPTALRSMPNSPLRSTDKIKLSRSDSCIANLSLETSYTTLQEIMK